MVEFVTEKVELRKLIHYKDNPRKSKSGGKEILKTSLKKYGLVDLIVTDFDYTVISGNTRLTQLKSIYGNDYIIEIRRAKVKMSEEDFKEYNILANSHSGEFDYGKLLIDNTIDKLYSFGFKRNNFEEFLNVKNKEQEKKEGNFFLEEMELLQFEHHDYIVLKCNDFNDFKRALELFGIRNVKYPVGNNKSQIGLGRVVNVKKLFSLLQSSKNNDNE